MRTWCSGSPRSTCRPGEYDRALARIDALKTQGKDSAGGRTARRVDARAARQESRRQVAARRARALVSRARRFGRPRCRAAQQGWQSPTQADRVLAELPCPPSPITPTLVMMRAQIQAESLKNVEQARSLLLSIGEKTENSAPLVQLAGLELERNELDSRRSRDRQDPIRAGKKPPPATCSRRSSPSSGAIPTRPSNTSTPALRKTRETRSSSTGRPSSTARPATWPRPTKSLEAIIKNKPIKEVDTGHDAHVRRPVGPGRSLAADRCARRRHTPIRGVEARSTRTARSTRPTAGS